MSILHTVKTALTQPAWKLWRAISVQPAIAFTAIFALATIDGAVGAASAKPFLRPQSAQSATTVGEISYSSQIRPILSQNCFSCHGPDEKKRESGLRLDHAGQADWDEVLERLESADPDFMMPPPTTNKTVSPAQRELLRRWIAAGANYEQHWAFVRPSKPRAPVESHPVDFFIDQKLAERAWQRSEQADPYLLIRRVYLDLIGLPPPLSVADRFAAAPTQTAYEAIVDSLLQSPRYGERWARRWLDLARYADTNGYEKDRNRSIWPYRDWVIRAINADMPFDQFTVEQIAGDMLSDPTIEQLVATGFHRNTMLNEEGGIDPLEFRYHAMTDRVATTGTTWLGLTTGCAQCHTHKYDPITHEDYFGIFAYLNNCEEPDGFIPHQDAKTRHQRNLAEAGKLLTELPQHWPLPESIDAAQTNDVNTPEDQQSTNDQAEPSESDVAIARAASLEEAFLAWLKQQSDNVAQWRVLEPTSLSANVPYLIAEPAGVVFAGGDISKHDIYELQFSTGDRPIRSLRIEALPDPRLPGGGPGLTYYEGRKGDFYLTELEARSGEQAIQFDHASDSYSQNGFGNSDAGARRAIDNDIQSGWSVARREGEQHVAIFRFTQPLATNTQFTLTMHFGRHYASSLGKFRVSGTDDSRELLASTLGPDLVEALQNEEIESLVEHAGLRTAFLLNAPELKKQADRIRQLQRAPLGTPTLIMRERPAGFQRKTFVHHRGEFTQPTVEAAPRLPEAIFPEQSELPTNRLEFARWLVSRDNPLTARVVANRQWAAFFGRGIVSTIDDFGMQGDSPTHPELLDFLAVDLMDNDWSIKSLHRLIVTSGAYQQSSRLVNEVPPPNARELLGHFHRNRLEAEIIRDSALFAAGLLNETMFGPPVRPPQPDGAVGANYARSKWTASQGADRFRRSIYTFQQRTSPFAMFTTFDAGSGEACLARRDVSNTPLQALTLMNDPMFVEIAEAFGQRMANLDAETYVDAQSRLKRGFRWLMTRPPTNEELEMLSAFYQKHQSWTAVARVLLCLDEAITKN